MFENVSVQCMCSSSLSSSNSSSHLSLSPVTLQKMDAVELFAAGEKGRGLRTTKEMKPGEVVFTEATFAAVVFDRWDQCMGCVVLTLGIGH